MKMKKKVGTKRKRNEEKHVDLKIRPYILFRSSSSNDHIHINDRGSKNFLQKYFAEPYFSICFFCCRSVLPSWLPEHPELPELPELPNCPNFRTAGTP